MAQSIAKHIRHIRHTAYILHSLAAHFQIVSKLKMQMLKHQFPLFVYINFNPILTPHTDNRARHSGHSTGHRRRCIQQKVHTTFWIIPFFSIYIYAALCSQCIHSSVQVVVVVFRDIRCFLLLLLGSHSLMLCAPADFHSYFVSVYLFPTKHFLLFVRVACISGV